MDCTEVKYMIVDRIDENLPKSLLEQIDKHIETCDNCQEEYIQSGKILHLISEIEDEKPDESLKQDFYKMLEKEVRKQSKDSIGKQTLSLQRNISIAPLKYAAAVIILISIGFMAGHLTQKNTQAKNEIAALQQEVSQLQQHASLVSLQKPSASERLKIINTVDKETEINKDLVTALVNTLNTDDNVNVRMAAAYALAKYPDNEFVRSSLIQSLEQQTEPILQIILIGIMVDIQDERAKPVIENIINNDNILPEVKEQASKVLTVFQS